MSTETKASTKEIARKEVMGVLRKYRVKWLDVAPDFDEEIWRQVMPVARKVRSRLFRNHYPSAYAASKQKER